MCQIALFLKMPDRVIDVVKVGGSGVRLECGRGVGFLRDSSAEVPLLVDVVWLEAGQLQNLAGAGSSVAAKEVRFLLNTSLITSFALFLNFLTGIMHEQLATIPK